MVDDAPSNRVGTVNGLQSKQSTGDRANGSEQLDDRVQAYIGRQLRVIYDTIVNEEVPDSLLDLLRQVDNPPTDAKPKKK